jgi:hypothetical protein
MSRVFQNIYLPTPLSAWRVCPPPATKAGVHTRRAERGVGGQYFGRRKTKDWPLTVTVIISLRFQVSGLNVVTNKTISAHTLYLPAMAHSLRLEQEQLQHIGVNPCRESVCSYLCLITPSRFSQISTVCSV